MLLPLSELITTSWQIYRKHINFFLQYAVLFAFVFFVFHIFDYVDAPALYFFAFLPARIIEFLLETIITIYFFRGVFQLYQHLTPPTWSELFYTTSPYTIFRFIITSALLALITTTPLLLTTCYLLADKIKNFDLQALLLLISSGEWSSLVSTAIIENASVGVAIAIFVSFIYFVCTSIYLTFSLFVIAVENEKVFSALRTSYLLVKNKFFPICWRIGTPFLVFQLIIPLFSFLSVSFIQSVLFVIPYSFFLTVLSLLPLEMFIVTQLVLYGEAKKSLEIAIR